MWLIISINFTFTNVKIAVPQSLQINPKLKEMNQYGINKKEVALSLMVTGNVVVNKVGMLVNGITCG